MQTFSCCCCCSRNFVHTHKLSDVGKEEGHVRQEVEDETTIENAEHLENDASKYANSAGFPHEISIFLVQTCFL